METKIKIGEKIRLLRKKNDVTQDKLAYHLGVTPQAVSRWESGVCYPDMNYLPAIADYFSVTMDELLAQSDFVSLLPSSHLLSFPSHPQVQIQNLNIPISHSPHSSHAYCFLP